MASIPLVDLAAQYRSIKDDINNAINDVLSDCSFILGGRLNEFERAFSKFIGTDHAVGVSNGLDALRLSLAVLDIGSGDDVILPANTYIATALAVSAVGARPVLVDCDPGSYNIDVSQIDSTVKSSTKAIIPVHLTGQSADMDPIFDIAARHGLHIIEDAAQAHGAQYKDRPCGSMGVLGCFSFYPGKNLGAYGDGGMVTTQDQKYADRIKHLRNYGEREKYHHIEQGYNARLDTIQAAVLYVKLNYISRWNNSRARIAKQYTERLTGVGDLRFQKKVDYSTHVYHLYIIETNYRNALQEHLNHAGIGTGIHYPYPIHLQKAYEDLGYQKGDFPNAEKLAQRILSLPMYPELTDKQLDRVVTAVKSFFATKIDHGHAVGSRAYA